MSENDLAEKLWRANHPSPWPAWYPYGNRGRFQDMWPSEQERYRKMARALTKDGEGK